MNFQDIDFGLVLVSRTYITCSRMVCIVNITTSYCFYDTFPVLPTVFSQIHLIDPLKKYIVRKKCNATRIVDNCDSFNPVREHNMVCLQANSIPQITVLRSVLVQFNTKFHPCWSGHTWLYVLVNAYVHVYGNV